MGVCSPWAWVAPCRAMEKTLRKTPVSRVNRLWDLRYLLFLVYVSTHNLGYKLHAESVAIGLSMSSHLARTRALKFVKA